MKKTGDFFVALTPNQSDQLTWTPYLTLATKGSTVTLINGPVINVRMSSWNMPIAFIRI